MHFNQSDQHVLLLLGKEPNKPMVHSWVKKSGFQIEFHCCEESLYRSLETKTILLLLIAWDTQNTDGSASTLARVKESIDEQIRLVVLADNDPEKDVVTALQTGADRYVSLDNSVRVIDELINALLRRLYPENECQHFPPYRINQMTRQVIFADHCIQLTPREFRIAQYLFENNDQILSREALLRDIWGLPNLAHPRRVDTKMSHVRRKIRLDGSYGWELQYPRGMGYKLVSGAGINSASW